MPFKNQKLNEKRDRDAEIFITSAADEAHSVKGPGGRPRTRGETTRTTIYLDVEVHKSLALYSSVQGLSMTFILNQLAQKLLAENTALIKKLKALEVEALEARENF